ncbi:MAG: hypothetical protein DWQ36_16960 [Acidobacteria bacterium]|nr:MAG: hypothetical protein DWQ30_05055 [Acidobacteriota bacterium]REK04541.1 MAG: hypothetical protein DWQ36_16960 [Acidobacteriota bacterium]
MFELPFWLTSMNTGQTIVFVIGVLFAVAVLVYSARRWQVDLLRLRWAGRLTRLMMREGWAIYREARKQTVDDERARKLADERWEERPLSDDEIAARLALWVLVEQWHDGPENELRWRADFVQLSRANALRHARDKRLLVQLFEQIRQHHDNPPRTRHTLHQLVPEVGGGIMRHAP